MALPRPAGYTNSISFRVRMVDAGPNRATVYVALHNASGNVIRRYRVNTTGVGSILASTEDIANDVNNASTWDAALAGPLEALVYRSTANSLLVMQTGSGDPASSSMIAATLGAVGSDTSAQIAIAVRNASAAWSASNPLGIMSASSAPGGSRFFAWPTSTASVAVPGSSGTYGDAFATTTRVVPVPGSTPYMPVGHWYLVASDPDTSMSGNPQRVRGWDARAGAMPTVAPLLGAIEAASAMRTDVSVASDGTTVRVAERDAAGNVVTRPIGCP